MRSTTYNVGQKLTCLARVTGKLTTAYVGKTHKRQPVMDKPVGKEGEAQGQDYCDFTLVAQGQSLRTSRWLLARHSSVLKGMLADTKATKLTLDDDSPLLMERILNQLSPTKPEQLQFTNMEDALAMLELARKYNLQMLKDCCEKYLSPFVVNEPAKMAAVADTYDLQLLRTTAIAQLSRAEVSMREFRREELVKCRTDTLVDIFTASYRNKCRILEFSASLPENSPCPPGWTRENFLLGGGQRRLIDPKTLTVLRYY
eukprot:jgi/Chlat1/2558/Chrsp175S02409